MVYGVLGVLGLLGPLPPRSSGSSRGGCQSNNVDTPIFYFRVGPWIIWTQGYVALPFGPLLPPQPVAEKPVAEQAAT